MSKPEVDPAELTIMTRMQEFFQPDAPSGRMNHNQHKEKNCADPGVTRM